MRLHNTLKVLAMSQALVLILLSLFDSLCHIAQCLHLFHLTPALGSHFRTQHLCLLFALLSLLLLLYLLHVLYEAVINFIHFGFILLFNILHLVKLILQVSLHFLRVVGGNFRTILRNLTILENSSPDPALLTAGHLLEVLQRDVLDWR